MNNPSKKVLVIDTKPTDKGLFDPQIGGHKFQVPFSSYQTLAKSAPGRYKLLAGQGVEETGNEKVIPVRKSEKPEGVKEIKAGGEVAKVSADFQPKDAIAEIKKFTTVPELDKFIDGEIRKTVNAAYQAKLAELKKG